MDTEIIAPGEAWEEVERLKIDINHNRIDGKWYATYRHESGQWDIGSGGAPLEAVAHLLARIAEQKAKGAPQ